MPDEFRGTWSLADLERPRNDGEGMLGGMRCHRVTSLRPKAEFTLWLDADEFLVRRTLELTRHGCSRERDEMRDRYRHALSAGVERGLLRRHLDHRFLVPPKENDAETETTTTYQVT